MTEAEKKVIWNDPEKLGEAITTLAGKLVQLGNKFKYWHDKKTDDGKAMEQADRELNILDETYKKIDAEGIELVKRLMELEKQELSASDEKTEQ